MHTLLLSALTICAASIALDAYAAPPVRPWRSGPSYLFEFGRLQGPVFRTVPITLTAPPKRLAAPKKEATKAIPPVVVKVTKRPTIAPPRTVVATEETATLGLALRAPIAAKFMQFIYLTASVHALVPALTDNDVFDATLHVRRRPEPAVEADLAIELRLGDLLVAVGAGHGLKRGLGLSFFAIISYSPQSSEDERAAGVPELVIQAVPPPTLPIAKP